MEHSRAVKRMGGWGIGVWREALEPEEFRRRGKGERLAY